MHKLCKHAQVGGQPGSRFVWSIGPLSSLSLASHPECVIIQLVEYIASLDLLVRWWSKFLRVCSLIMKCSNKKIFKV